MSVWVVLKSLKKNCQAKKGFIVCWWVKHLLMKSMNMFLKFKMKIIKDYFKMWCFADVFEKKSEIRVWKWWVILESLFECNRLKLGFNT